MKYLKMLGLAAVAAAVLTAFAGASTASASVLCKEAKETCPAGSRVKFGEEVNMQLVPTFKASLNTGPKNSECSKSTIAGEVTNEGGKGIAPEVAVKTLTFTECTNCEVVVLKKGTYYISHTVPTVNGTPFGTGQEFTVQCETVFGLVHCIHATKNTPLGELLGGNPGIVEVNAEVPRLATNGLCKEQAIWTGRYEVTKPKPVFVEFE